jgi:hypothetical protein
MRIRVVELQYWCLNQCRSICLEVGRWWSTWFLAATHCHHHPPARELGRFLTTASGAGQTHQTRAPDHDGMVNRPTT